MLFSLLIQALKELEVIIRQLLYVFLIILKAPSKKSGSGTIDTRVDEDYVKKLLGYFKNKGR